LSNQNSINQVIKLIKELSTNPLRKAYLIAKVIKEKGLTKKELAYLLDKSPSYVSNHLRLIDLPEAIKDALLSGVLSEGHARALSFLENKADATKIYETILRYGYSVREVEKEVNKYRKNKRRYGKVSDELKEMEKQIEERIGAKANIRRSRKQLVFTIQFPLGIVGIRKLKQILALIISRG
jgi:ParB family chromosome partitioning protein